MIQYIRPTEFPKRVARESPKRFIQESFPRSLNNFSAPSTSPRESSEMMSPESFPKWCPSNVYQRASQASFPIEVFERVPQKRFPKISPRDSPQDNFRQSLPIDIAQDFSRPFIKLFPSEFSDRSPLPAVFLSGPVDVLDTDGVFISAFRLLPMRLDVAVAKQRATAPLFHWPGC